MAVLLLEVLRRDRRRPSMVFDMMIYLYRDWMLVFVIYGMGT